MSYLQYIDSLPSNMPVNALPTMRKGQQLPPLPKPFEHDFSDSNEEDSPISPTSNPSDLGTSLPNNATGQYKKLGRKISPIGLDQRMDQGFYPQISSSPTRQGSPTRRPVASPSPPPVVHEIPSEVVQIDTDQLVNMLQDNEQGMEILLHRVKECINSSKSVTGFMEKRAAIERAYGKAMLDLSKSCIKETESKTDPCRQGSFGSQWRQILDMHAIVANNRIAFADKLQELSNECNVNDKNADRERRQLKESAQKFEREMLEAMRGYEKAERAYFVANQEWEKNILTQQQLDQGSDGVYLTMAPPPSNSITATLRKGLPGLVKPQNPTDKARQAVYQSKDRAIQANIQYQNQIAYANGLRKKFFQDHVPRIIRGLKEASEHCDTALRGQLAKYAWRYEQALMADATTLSPMPGEGYTMSKMVEAIADDVDFSDYVAREIATKRAKYDKTDVVNRINAGMPVGNSKPQTIFGIELSQVMEREGGGVPLVLTKCTEAVERWGITTPGIYRLSPPHQSTQRLRAMFDANATDVQITPEMCQGDGINTVAALVKLYLRELPEPLLTTAGYQDFLHAARMHDERMRGQRVHELVNNLPDSNYVVLKHLVKHIRKVASNASYNKMTIESLAKIFAPGLINPCGRATQTQPMSPIEIQANYETEIQVVTMILQWADKIFDFESE